MANIQIPIYIADDDFAVYLANKKELIDLARDTFKARFEELLSEIDPEKKELLEKKLLQDIAGETNDSDN